MRIAIVDDNRMDLKQLTTMLQSIFSNQQAAVEVLTFNDADSFLSCFMPDKFQMIFLDILMPDCSGLTLAKKVRDIDAEVKIVFVTITSDYAVDSYEVNAFHYLLKPITTQKLERIIMKQADSILDSRALTVKVQQEDYQILLKDLIYASYYKHYIFLHTTSGTVRTYMKFSDFAPLVLDEPWFCQCNKGLIVNCAYISRIEKNRMFIENHPVFTVSRSHLANLKRTYAQYVFHAARNRRLVL